MKNRMLGIANIKLITRDGNADLLMKKSPHVGMNAARRRHAYINSSFTAAS